MQTAEVMQRQNVLTMRCARGGSNLLAGEEPAPTAMVPEVYPWVAVVEAVVGPGAGAGAGEEVLLLGAVRRAALVQVQASSVRSAAGGVEGSRGSAHPSTLTPYQGAAAGGGAMAMGDAEDQEPITEASLLRGVSPAGGGAVTSVQSLLDEGPWWTVEENTCLPQLQQYFARLGIEQAWVVRRGRLTVSVAPPAMRRVPSWLGSNCGLQLWAPT